MGSSVPRVVVARENSGFTLIELILVVVALVLVGSGALLVFNNQQLGNLESDAEIIATRLSEAQYRAVAGIEGMPWGLYFDNATTTPYYALFAGTGFLAPSSTYYLSGVVEFQNPASGATSSVVFHKFSGSVSSSVSIVLRLKTDTTISKTITIAPQGSISVEY